MGDSSDPNQQILDALKEIQEALQTLLTMGASADQSQAAAQQLASQAISVAMQNAVAQQQQTYILQNAVTAAAAKVILEGSPEDAIRLAREVLSGNDLVPTLNGLKDLMDEVNSPDDASAPEAAAPKPEADHGKKKTGRRSRRSS